MLGVLLKYSIFQAFELVLVNMLEGWFVTLSYYPIIPTHKLTLIRQIIANFSFLLKIHMGQIPQDGDFGQNVASFWKK